MASSSSSRYAVPVACAVVVILLALAVIQQMNHKEEVAVSVDGTGSVEVRNVEMMDTTPSPAPTTPDPAPSDAGSQQDTAPAYAYEDGTYTATGSYTSPGGAESILLTVTIEDDLITSATVVPQAERPASVNWQNTFISGFQPLVLGKSLDEVNLTKVSGSSLTPKGFNDALAKIKVDASV